MTQEFHISVTPVGQNDYLVRTEQVAPGVPLAEELVTWPVGDWLTAAGHLMNDPLKSVLQGDALARNSVNLVALGQQFYNALFQGTLRDSWITAQGIAQNHQQVLRLRLGLKDTRLARLPWEVMHAGDRPIATGPYIAFSRYQSGIGGGSRLPSTSMPIPTDEGGIKVLMAIASPTDLVRLDLLKQEAIKLQAELHRDGEGGNSLPQIELTLLEQPGREELTQALEQGRYHVLHYSGHSNIASNGGEIYLVSNRTGLRETLSGDDLAGLLVNNNIQMAVFNSCLGTYAATSSDPTGDTGERNLTETLVKRGIRSVLAMSERIPDEVALLLTQLFYRNLSQGYSLDLCVSRMRQGLIAGYGSHQLYWALPILYLQPEFDGYLSPGVFLPEDEELFNEYNSSLKTTATIYSDPAHDAEMALPIEDMLPSDLTREPSDLDWLGEETWGDLVDEIEYDDPSYEEDSAIVSDLFRQLDKQKTSEQSSMKAELVQFGEDGLDETEVSGEIASLENDVRMWEEVRKAASYGKLGASGSREHPSNSELTRQEAGLQAGWDDSNAGSLAQRTTPASQTPKAKRGKRRKLLGVVGAVGVSAIAAVVGFNWWSHNQQISKQPSVVAIHQSEPNSNTPQINLKTVDTQSVSALATEKLSQGDLQVGLQAVEELLNRNVLSNAESALNAVPQASADNPSIYFFKGRLAWQSIQTGDNKYSVDDARRYWESALKAQPDSVLYSNALGFAYYAQGNINRANDSWFKALSLAVREQNRTAASPTAFSPSKPVPRDALTAYAGLALGLYKTASNQPAGKREQYLNEAIKLRQMVIKEDPINFEMRELGKNWLWTEKALQDWKALLQQKTQRSSLEN
ncbi:heterocyst differentiation protein HetF [Scytonema sp. HK-05]|uniref:cell division protein HetF n=1 Tax=Scytonema sp. HK-05 TaxID=1137095 RepID=UPI000937C7FC|nr:cell division protein HetF [Scytonema sp. HK-05]OKH56586.1 heterocyst differentiation protein [Scytonema sp. HK-05]BAY47641.1 heterocyst differentiation protein HetF [Scytonema sp. HK-05]